jgi:hypothetical protein
MFSFHTFKWLLNENEEQERTLEDLKGRVELLNTATDDELDEVISR